MTIGGRLSRFVIEGRPGAPAPRPLPLLGITVALLALAIAWHPLSPVCLVVSGALLTVVAARQDRVLLAVALAAFAVRAVLVVTLSALTALDLNLLRGLQEGELAPGYGRWIFALDAQWYHWGALQVIDAWTHGIEFPSGTSPEYYVFTAVVYGLFGPHPLNVVLWNALFGALTVVLGYRIAARLGGPGAARVTAVLLAFWPSAILWSSQLLKDTITIWLTFAVLYLTMRLVEPPPVAGARALTAARWMARLVLLFAAAFVLYRYRSYVVLVLIMAPAAFVVQALVRRTRHTPWRVFAACAVAAVTLLGLVTSRRVDFQRMWTSSDPHVARVRLGVVHHSRGELDLAKANYQGALRLAPEYPPALERLAIVAIARDERAVAIGYLQRSLARDPANTAARAMLDAVLSTPEGLSLQRIRLPDIAFDPASVTAPPVTGRPTTIGPPPRAVISPYSDLSVAIRVMRDGFDRARGRSTVDAGVHFHGYRDILLYVPRALSNVLLTPYPWQWFESYGSTGPFKALSAVEAILVYVLIVPLVVGLGIVVLRGSPDALYLAVFVVTLTAVLGLVVNNVGTLFRLRLTSLLPLFTVGGIGWMWLRRHRWGRA